MNHVIHLYQDYESKEKTIRRIELDDLDLEEEDVEAKTKTIEIFLPPKKEAGNVLEGELDSQVKELVQLLHTEAKVI